MLWQLFRCRLVQRHPHMDFSIYWDDVPLFKDSFGIVFKVLNRRSGMMCWRNETSTSCVEVSQSGIVILLLITSLLIWIIAPMIAKTVSQLGDSVITLFVVADFCTNIQSVQSM